MENEKGIILSQLFTGNNRCSRCFCEYKRQYQLSHQVDVVEDESCFVHLAQDEQHLVVNELFVFLQVAVHVLLQLCTDLTKKLYSIVRIVCAGFLCCSKVLCHSHWEKFTSNSFPKHYTSVL